MALLYDDIKMSNICSRPWHRESAVTAAPYAAGLNLGASTFASAYAPIYEVEWTEEQNRLPEIQEFGYEEDEGWRGEFTGQGVIPREGPIALTTESSIATPTLPPNPAATTNAIEGIIHDIQAATKKKPHKKKGSHK